MIDTRRYQFMKSQKQGYSYFFKQPTVRRRTKTIKQGESTKIKVTVNSDTNMCYRLNSTML